MKHARFFFVMVASVLATYGLFGFYFLPYASFEGDLTRMAKLPESDFGWTREQPSVEEKWMQSASWEEADVLAIGDSFTTAQMWQTVLTQRGLRVHTESWANIYSLCADLGGWIRSKGFKGKLVVIESAEKYLEGRLAQSAACRAMSYHPLPAQPAHVPSSLPDRGSNYGGSMSVGIQTALNQHKYRQLSDQPDFTRLDGWGEVNLVRLSNGCELFSHPRCQDVLFYQKDRTEDMGEGVLTNMAEINKRLSGYDVVWMVIPDKASVYLPGDKQFWNEAERRFRAPNLLKVLQQERNKNMDLYLANNTHVSTRGYLVLGEAIYQRLRP